MQFDARYRKTLALTVLSHLSNNVKIGVCQIDKNEKKQKMGVCQILKK